MTSSDVKLMPGLLAALQVGGDAIRVGVGVSGAVQLAIPNSSRRFNRS
jgi:hypothetical protein